MKKSSLAFLIIFLSAASSAWASEARSIPIQHNGRVKAFDTFARQAVETITGRERWQKKAAYEFIFENLADEEKLSNMQWIEVRYTPLASALGLENGRSHFAYHEIMPSLSKIEAMMKSASEKRDAERQPSKTEIEAETLYGRLVAVKGLMTGSLIRVLPPTNGETWLSAYQSIDPRAARFQKLVAESGDFYEWNQKVFAEAGGNLRQTMRLELIYSDLRPFQWSWILYLAGFALISAFKRGRFSKTAAVTLILAAFIFHSLGLVLRVWILERPPVSNMYESMVYMNWVLMLVAFVFALLRRSLVPLSVGAAASALVMIYGNLLPLDTDLEVLVPVLRSNYWLTIHVMTIVSSYGAFGLAMALGHRHLILKLRRKLSKSADESSAQLIYRVIQLGVLLLGIGTVLGGVWANESWGRFWGWDPKETWALITFLVYLVVIHLRFTKVIDNFWLAVSSILGFLSVLMTWYGVNFVLGKGLHSYGFGSGGMAWILGYLIVEAVFLTKLFYGHFNDNCIQ